MGMRDAF